MKLDDVSADSFASSKNSHQMIQKWILMSMFDMLKRNFWWEKWDDEPQNINKGSEKSHYSIQENDIMSINLKIFPEVCNVIVHTAHSQEP